MTSEGCSARADTMFSARQAYTVMSVRTPSSAAARTAPTTVAAPDMSDFMVTIPAGGFIE